MGINNSPTLNDIGGLSKFRFWCQKVLPLVYDDSLSYYEALCKIANKLNEAIISANTSQENVVLLKQAYDELLEYINNYTKTLDATIVEEVNAKLNNMVESGELYNYVVSRITAGDIGAAPAGYGLGEFGGKNIAGVDLNTVFENGWHTYNGQGSLINGPDGYDVLGNFAILEVSTAPFNNMPITCVQTLTFGAGGLEGYQCKRAYNGANWLSWCWINPPMVVGKEYRTTERYLGKPVYYQLVSAGNLPNATTRTVDTTELTNPIYYILSVHGRTTIQNRTIPQGEYISVRGGYGNITLETTVDYSDDEAELVVKYYKPYE